jgi:hypothetical protein
MHAGAVTIPVNTYSTYTYISTEKLVPVRGLDRSGSHSRMHAVTARSTYEAAVPERTRPCVTSHCWLLKLHVNDCVAMDAACIVDNVYIFFSSDMHAYMMHQHG